MHVYEWEEDRKKGVFMDKKKSLNQPHQIILTFDLRVLKFIAILKCRSFFFYYFKIQFNGEWRCNDYKIMSDAKSWDDKVSKGLHWSKVAMWPPQN